MALAGSHLISQVDVNNIFAAQMVPVTPGIPKAVNPDIFDGKVFNTFSPISRCHIVVVGTGGTGGYVVRDLARLIHGKSKDCNMRLTLIDPDKVEDRNLIRQNFILQDIDRPKAEVLAERYSGAFGLDIEAITEYCTAALLSKLYRARRNLEPMLIIGCVDNNEARRSIHAFIHANMRYDPAGLAAWIDSGNESSSGQVVMGALAPGLSKYNLPFVTQLYPEILDPTKDPKEVVSCAERAQRDIQNIFVNLTAATNILNFVNMIFSQKKSCIYGVEFGITGATKPLYLMKDYKRLELIPKGESLWQ